MINNVYPYFLILMMLVLGIFYNSINGNILCNGAPVQYDNKTLNNWNYGLIKPTKPTKSFSENRLLSNVSNPLFPPVDTISYKNKEEKMVRNIVLLNSNKNNLKPHI